MKKRSILIFTPDENLKESLCNAVIGDPNFCLGGCFATISEVINNLGTLDPDLLILDMDFGTECDLFRLQEANSRCALILMSASTAYAWNAFRFLTVDYLKKPVSAKSVRSALEKYLHLAAAFCSTANNEIQKGTSYPGRILVDQLRKHVSIPIDDIVYLKAERDHTRIFTRNERSYLSTFGIGIVEQRLDPAKFIRVHRSFIINTEYITGGYRDISKLYLTLPNQTDVSVGRKYLPAIKSLIF